MRQRRARGFRLSGLLVALCLVAAACTNSGGDDEKTAPPPSSTGGRSGVSATEIKFSVLATKTNNPTGACILDCFVDGISAYFAYRNSEGGVHGRKLVLDEPIDDELGKNREGALRIITAGNTFATFGAAQLPTGWAELAKVGIPQYVWAIQPGAMVNQKAIFGNAAPICLECTTRTYPLVAGLAKATKVAALGYGVSDVSKKCTSTIVDTINFYQSETGQEIVYKNDGLAFGLPNGVGPEVSEMKQNGTQIIMTCMDLNGMKTLAQELERQGMQDVILYHSNTYDQKFVEEAGDLFEGDYIGVSFRPFEADPGTTGLADYFRWMEETGSEITEAAMAGWIDADLAYQGIVAAGPDFTRASVIDATNKMTEYSADGLISPIDWSRQHQFPTQQDPTTHGYKFECQALVKVRNGKFEVVGGTKQDPFACWSNENRNWSQPRAMSFS